MMKARALAAAACLAAIAGGGGPAAAGTHPVDRLAPGHWLEVPDSQLRKVAFKWPRKKAEPLLKDALAAQSGASAEAIKKALEELK